MAPLIPISILLALGISVCFLMYFAAYHVGPRNPISSKLTTYECGVTPEGGAHTPFRSHFYLIAVLFLLFDVEAAFFLPWALIYKESLAEGATVLLAGSIYLGLMGLGLVYIFRKGCFRVNG